MADARDHRSRAGVIMRQMRPAPDSWAVAEGAILA